MKKSKINIPLLIAGIVLAIAGFALFILSLYKLTFWAALIFLALFVVGIIITAIQISKPVSQKLKEKNIEYIKELKKALQNDPPVSPVKSFKDDDFKFCPECGALNDGDAKFCKECGKKF